MMTRRHLLASALAPAALSAAGAAAQSGAGPSPARIGIGFAGRSLAATLFDTPSSRDLLALLPLDLQIEDYSSNEKIVRLPRKLGEEGSGPFSGEAPGDLCYFAPWGNLALFYAGYAYSSGLIRLGRMDGWQDVLRMRGTFPVRITRLSPNS